jgi:hypothetical protein
MEITRNIILDLLPLYLADEVSEDTRILVTKYLEVDMELAEIVKQKISTTLVDDFPAPLTSDRELEIYREVKRLMFWRTVIAISLAAMVFMTLILFAGIFLFLRM